MLGVITGMRLGFALAIGSLVLLFTLHITACTLAPGYFYQITALKGRVVGTHGYHTYASRWFRQRFARKHANLALYKYSQPPDETVTAGWIILQMIEETGLPKLAISTRAKLSHTQHAAQDLI